jgi:hypothetical protein
LLVAGAANIPQSIVASAAASGEWQVSVNHSQLAFILLTATGYFSFFSNFPLSIFTSSPLALPKDLLYVFVSVDVKNSAQPRRPN